MGFCEIIVGLYRIHTNIAFVQTCKTVNGHYCYCGRVRKSIMKIIIDEPIEIFLYKYFNLHILPTIQKQIYLLCSLYYTRAILIRIHYNNII